MASISVPVNIPDLSGNEKKYLNACIDSGWISSEGPFVKRFEADFSKYVGRKHGVAVANGSCALELAFKVIDLKPGDEVILPSFTIMSCLIPIIRMGAIPVFLDSDKATWNADITDLERKIGPKTKAILAVHIYGLPCEINEIVSLAEKHNIYVLEDAAEMHGQTVAGQQCGSFGHLSIFSFYPNKHITTGEGGMVLTDDDELANKLRWYMNLCFGYGHERYEHADFGWNFRMTNLQAAVGVAQLERLDQQIIKKRSIGKRYTEALHSRTDLFQIPLDKTDLSENIYWVYGLVFHEKIRERFMNYLDDNRIGSRRFFCPLHKQKAFLNLFPKQISLPISEGLYDRGCYIPSGLGMSLNQQDFVIQKILQF